MKKFALSFLVIFTFGIYVLYQKLGQGNVVAPNITNSQPAVINNTSNTNSNNNSNTTTSFKDGTYTGDVADAYYGNVQVQAVISSGKITDVQFLQYPSDRGTSVEINSQAMPLLKQEAIQAQNFQVDIVSGATQTSGAFRQSLQSALNQAKS